MACVLPPCLYGGLLILLSPLTCALQVPAWSAAQVSTALVDTGWSSQGNSTSNANGLKDKVSAALVGTGRRSQGSKTGSVMGVKEKAQPANEDTALNRKVDLAEKTQPVAWSMSWDRAMSNCRYIFGFPKFAWALLCDVLSLTLVLLCIPLLLTCSRRRPPGAPLFDCSFGGSDHASTKQAPWQTG
mmetsp:Transcript_40914/g.113754  ORF Transcript_40914/g.113754 Transcript_40914/m.113754 type:complete len:186 (-) Transcript_40914:183-740(-)